MNAMVGNKSEALRAVAKEKNMPYIDIDTQPAPDAHAPTISSSSMLVELSVSHWTGRKLDRRASKDVTATNNAASGVANVNKSYSATAPN